MFRYSLFELATDLIAMPQCTLVPLNRHFVQLNHAREPEQHARSALLPAHMLENGKRCRYKAGISIY